MGQRPERWVASVTVGYAPDGKRIVKRARGRTKSEAQRKLKEIIREYDIVVDGTDNFPTRYLVNDACVLLGKPNVYGSIFRFEGQITIFGAPGGPCGPVCSRETNARERFFTVAWFTCVSVLYLRPE